MVQELDVEVSIGLQQDRLLLKQPDPIPRIAVAVPKILGNMVVPDLTLVVVHQSCRVKLLKVNLWHLLIKKSPYLGKILFGAYMTYLQVIAIKGEREVR